MAYETISMGSLMVGSQRVQISRNPSDIKSVKSYDGVSSIKIVNTCLGNKSAITWIQPNKQNILVADRILLRNITFDSLRANGFADGKICWIDGNRYICRLLQVDEWFKCLDASDSLCSIQHWKANDFWGKDGSLFLCGEQTVLPHSVPHKWVDGGEDDIKPFIGFRPVLVHLDFSCFTAKKIILDEHCFCIRADSDSANQGEFRPIISPAKGDFTFGNIPPCDITLQMYTLLMDGVPVNTSRPATHKQNSTLSITDVFYGAEYLIPWRIFPDVAISESPLIKGISVDDLLRLEYITPSKGG